ncbi:unnamed protein product [Periconia digitata]|uniref:Uncharacterized protein n=1 Tax=Periconia digitata TaxID=1303443 RepID=A0A9W4TZG9_9PLEO|nr:unnamed protein product [Periconia digitata]
MFHLPFVLSSRHRVSSLYGDLTSLQTLRYPSRPPPPAARPPFHCIFAHWHPLPVSFNPNCQIYRFEHSPKPTPVTGQIMSDIIMDEDNGYAGSAEEEDDSGEQTSSSGEQSTRGTMSFQDFDGSFLPQMGLDSDNEAGPSHSYPDRDEYTSSSLSPGPFSSSDSDADNLGADGQPSASNLHDPWHFHSDQSGYYTSSSLSPGPFSSDSSADGQPSASNFQGPSHSHLNQSGDTSSSLSPGPFSSDSSSDGQPSAPILRSRWSERQDQGRVTWRLPLIDIHNDVGHTMQSAGPSSSSKSNTVLRNGEASNQYSQSAQSRSHPRNDEGHPQPELEPREENVGSSSRQQRSGNDDSQASASGTRRARPLLPRTMDDGPPRSPREVCRSPAPKPLNMGLAYDPNTGEIFLDPSTDDITPIPVTTVDVPIWLRADPSVWMREGSIPISLTLEKPSGDESEDSEAEEAKSGEVRYPGVAESHTSPREVLMSAAALRVARAASAERQKNPDQGILS